MVELNREHMKLIRAVICKTAGTRLPSDVIDDLASEATIALLEPNGSRSLSSYDAARGMSLTTFIGMVAQSVAMDKFRQRVRKDSRTSSLDVPPEEGGANALAALTDHAEDALSMLIRREQRERLQRAVETLSKSDRELLEATLTGDEAFTEKLAARGVSGVALRVRKCRLAERLRSAIQSQG